MQAMMNLSMIMVIHTTRTTSPAARKKKRRETTLSRTRQRLKSRKNPREAEIQMTAKKKR